MPGVRHAEMLRVPPGRARASASGAERSRRSSRLRVAIRAAIATAVVLLAGGSPPLEAQEAARPLRGFSPEGAAAELRAEAVMAEVFHNDSTGRHFRYLTEEPHPAGSERNRELAEYLRDRFVEYGLEDVAIHRYDVLLPLPREVSVTMLEPYRYEASLKEDGYPGDKDSYDADVGLTYMGMSASGDVTGDLIYAHSGNPEDYDWLERQGIDPRGKVAIVRYSVPYSYRGYKALVAQRRGVKALLVYSDPRDDGYERGLTYPDGPWGPESHIQRGAITYDFLVPGDPLTPGWPSVEGADRVSRDEARSIPRIIAVPMSYRDARPLLESLGGPVAPYDWQGGLPFTYRVGPGATKVRVEVDMDDEIRSIWVTEGRIRGSEDPDELVVLGNHRDAWVYGAVDPSSGTATQLELARALGEMVRKGHRPRRSIVLASWDAEEWHLTGSTEWGEQFADELREGAIAYLNVDGSTSGSQFGVGAVASLNRVVVQTVRDVADPDTRRSVLYAWKQDQRGDGSVTVIGGSGETTASDESIEDPYGAIDLVANELGSGSDYTVFLNFLGVPIVGMAFDGPYGVYHSQYDNFEWMAKFGDPGFRYMTTMGEIWGRMALRLANADVHPYDFRLYANRVRGFLDALGGVSGVADSLDLSPARRAVDDWARAAERLEGRVARALESGAGGTAAADGASAFTRLNDALRRVERELLLDEGIPDRPWYRHALYAPKYTYAAMSLPGVREAVDDGDWTRARTQLARLTERLEAVAETVARAADRVPGAEGTSTQP